MSSVLSAHCVNTIVTHARPHLDECAAIWALRRFGEAHFPGVRQATIEIFTPEAHTDECGEDSWLQRGYLFIGVAGGCFDDHPHERYPNDCAFTLVLKYLGIENDPGMLELAREVLKEDRNGSSSKLHFAPLIKTLSRLTSDVLPYVEPFLDGMYWQQRSFHQAVEIVRVSHPTSVTNQATGQPLVLVVAESDNEDISAAARWEKGANAALVVHRRPATESMSGGRLYISVNDRLIKDVTWLARMLRLEEWKARGGTARISSEQLDADGVLPEVPQWYYHKAAGQIFNGTLTAQHVPPTCLPLDTITDLCRAFLEGYPLRGRPNRT